MTRASLVRLLPAALLLAACGSAPSPAVCPPATPALAASPAPPAPLAPPAPVAQPDRPALPTTFDVAAVDAYLAAEVAARGLVGLSVALVRDGAIVHAKAYGHRALSPDVPATADTLFGVGSITKQFTSSAVLLLAQEKKLSLEDPVARYYPALTRARDITLYDLATHVSGYPDTYPLDFVDREMRVAVTPDEILRRYGTRPLDFEPRTRWSYTNTGYVILGRVVEKLSGKPLGAFFDERIFRPLGMQHTLYLPKADDPRLARGYAAFALGAPEPAEPEADGWSFGAGGIFATATDIARWDIALMSGKVLSPASYEKLTTARKLADGRSTGYGCGLGVGARHGDVVLHHGGGLSGFVADNAMAPRTRAAVVLLSNRGDVDIGDLTGKLMTLLLQPSAPKAPSVAGAPLADAARELFAAMQAGAVDRARLGDDFNAYLTDDKLRAAAPALRALGAPTAVEVTNVHERGGMEAATVLLTFPAKKLRVSTFRSADGKVQQFLIAPTP